MKTKVLTTICLLITLMAVSCNNAVKEQIPAERSDAELPKDKTEVSDTTTHRDLVKEQDPE